MIALTWWNRPKLKHYDALICDGAVRSGKTVCMADGFFLWSMACFDRRNFAICGRTVGALRRNILLELPKWLGDLFILQEHRTENKLVVRAPWGSCNSYYLFGGQDESAYMTVQGITLAGAFLDEVALMPRSFVEQVVARCSVAGSKLWFNCNPASQEHWFYKEWIVKAKEKNALRLHFTMADNPALDPAIRERYEKLYTGVFYRRYILGQWCMAEGLVYQLEKRHICQAPTQGRYYISVDYGTQNPFSAGLWCVTGEKAVRIREFYHNGRQSGRTLTDEDYYAQLERLAGEHPVEQVIVDPSASSFIACIRSHGRFSVRKAKNQVLPGIQLVARLLQQGVLGFTENCKDALREFSLYCWEENAQHDAPLKENDHAMDDIRYFCATVLRRLWPGGLYETVD